MRAKSRALAGPASPFPGTTAPAAIRCRDPPLPSRRGGRLSSASIIAAPAAGGNRPIDKYGTTPSQRANVDDEANLAPLKSRLERLALEIDRAPDDARVAKQRAREPQCGDCLPTPARSGPWCDFEALTPLVLPPRVSPDQRRGSRTVSAPERHERANPRRSTRANAQRPTSPVMQRLTEISPNATRSCMPQRSATDGAVTRGAHANQSASIFPGAA